MLVPTQRNSRDENAELQAGAHQRGGKQKPAKVRQKDRDARWTAMRRGDRGKFYNRPMQNLTFCNRVICCDRSLEVVNLHARDQADVFQHGQLLLGSGRVPKCEI